MRRVFLMAVAFVFSMGAQCVQAGTLTEPTKDVNGFALGTKQTNGTTTLDNSLLSCAVTLTDESVPPKSAPFSFTASAPTGGGTHAFAIPTGFVGVVSGTANCTNAIGTGPNATATSTGTSVGSPGAPTLVLP